MHIIRVFCIAICAQHWSVGASASTSTLLITGGAGLIGRYIAHQFCSNGWHVTVVDNLSNPHSVSPQQWPAHLDCPFGTLQFIEMDCREYFTSSESYRKWDLFVHLASVSEAMHAVKDIADSDGGEQLAHSLRFAGGNCIPQNMFQFSRVMSVFDFINVLLHLLQTIWGLTSLLSSGLLTGSCEPRD